MSILQKNIGGVTRIVVQVEASVMILLHLHHHHNKMNFLRNKKQEGKSVNVFQVKLEIQGSI